MELYDLSVCSPETGLHVYVSRAKGVERVHHTGESINVQATPPSSIEPEGVRQIEGVMRADVDVEARPFASEDVSQDHILAKLGVGHVEARVSVYPGRPPHPSSPDNLKTPKHLFWSHGL